MFGTYRTLLACLVLFQHLAHIPTIGKYAVVGFFVLSGYLMTHVMHGTYGYSIKGRFAFASNRALRLYPSYLVVVAMAVVIIMYVGGEVAREFREPLAIPRSAFEWLQNLTMVYFSAFPNEVIPRLSPATWALTIELFYYAMICLGVSKYKLGTWIWFFLGLGYHGAVNVMGLGEDYTYFHILSGSLPFSMGALLYHYRGKSFGFLAERRLNSVTGGAAFTIATSVLAIAGWAARQFGGDPAEAVCFYLNMMLAAVAVSSLARSNGSRRVDAFIGNFSYHIYILHWPVGLLVFTQLFRIASPSPSIAGLAASGFALICCLAVSYSLTRLVDGPVERLRRQLRSPAHEIAPSVATA